MNKDLKEKLKKDILSTGFPFEMEVSQVLRSSGWRVKNSPYYIDKDENKGREIDIISTIHKVYEIYKETSMEICFSLIMEIKKSEDKPWVFFTSDVTGPVEQLLHKDYETSGFVTQSHVINRLLRKNTQKVNSRIGRNFYQGFTKNGGRDDIYKALSGTLKATYHALENCSAKNNNSGDRYLHFFEPVVVIKGKIFEVYIDKEGSMKLEEVKYIQTDFNYMSPNYMSQTGNVVHIITNEYLPEFIAERKASLESLMDDILEVNVF